MNKEDFINQTLVGKLGDTLTFVPLEGDILEDIVIKADDENGTSSSSPIKVDIFVSKMIACKILMKIMEELRN